MTLSEITKAIEAGVAAVATNKAKSESADKIAAAAKSDYVAAVQAIHNLHAEYQKLMQDILSFGGTVHIGK